MAGDGQRTGEWHVDRRDFLVTATAAGGLAATGTVAAQEGGDGGSNGVNVDPDSAVTGSGSLDLGTEASVAALAEYFIEYPSPDHPVVGQTARLGGTVVNRIESQAEAAAFAESFDYGEFRPGDGAALRSLLEPVALLEGGEPDYAGLASDADSASSFFQSYDLLRIVGLTDRDQLFYSRYDYVPTLWLVVESGAIESARGRIDVSGWVRHAGADGTAGAYFEVQGVTEGETQSTLRPSTEAGEPVTVVGIKHDGERVLTTEGVEVSYDADGEFPRADGGSLVVQTGTTGTVDFERQPARVELNTTSQEILLGDTRVDGEADRAASNTVAVLDRSGSMDATDTRTGVTRLRVAKQSARALVNFVESGNRVGVTSFASDSRVVSPLTRLGSGSRNGLNDAIGRIRAEGSTSVGAGLLRAVTLLDGTEGRRSIILLSDGVQNTPPTPEEVLPRLKSLGVTVYTIGMGSGADRSLLRRIAEETGGEMQYRPEPGDVRELFQSFSTSIQQRATLTRRAHRLAEGETASGTAVVDGSVESAQFSLIYPGSEITVVPERPDGTAVSQSDAGVTRRVGAANEVWTIEDPATGEWGYTVTGEQLPQPEVANVQVSAESPVRARLLISDLHYEQTGLYRVELKLTDGEGRYTGADATLTAANGDRTERVTLRDDRTGPDPVADDGIYTGYFHPPTTGTWTLRAAIEGGTVDDLQREISRTLQVEATTETAIRPYLNREAASASDGSAATATTTAAETEAGTPDPDGGMGEMVPLAGGAALVLAAGAGVAWKLGRGDDESGGDGA
jgi:Mg-chelatase subunit ChlD